MREESKIEVQAEEMTLRDYFASAAMQAFSANPEMASFTYATVAQMAYAQADEMLKARKQ